MRYYSPYQRAGRSTARPRTRLAQVLIVFLFPLAACQSAGVATTNGGGSTGSRSTNPGILPPGPVSLPGVASLDDLAQAYPYTLVGTEKDVNGLPLNPMWATQAFYDRPDPCKAERDELIALNNTRPQAAPGEPESAAEKKLQQWQAQHAADLDRLHRKLDSPECVQWKPHVVSDPSYARLPDPSLCPMSPGGFRWRPWDTFSPEPRNRGCTLDYTWLNQPRNPFTRGFIGCRIGEAAGRMLAGHANWAVATFTGQILWDFWSDLTYDGVWQMDDDYNVEMYTLNRGGLTRQNRESLHMEFDSEETIDHFTSPFWQALHAEVQSHNQDGGRLSSHEAIAIGTFGLDAAHGPGSELHPVLGFAVHMNDNPNDDRWAIFARNMGNEGICSGEDEGYPLPYMSFNLTRPGASYVGYNYTDFATDCEGGVGPATGIDGPGVRGTDGGAVVTFGMPAPPLKKCWIGGELSIKWNVRTPSPPIQVALPPRGQEEYDTTEATIAALIQDLSPDQRAKFQQLRPRNRQVPLTHGHKPSPLGVTSPRNPTAIPRPSQFRNPQHEQRQIAFIEALRTAYGGSLPGDVPNRMNVRTAESASSAGNDVTGATAFAEPLAWAGTAPAPMSLC